MRVLKKAVFLLAVTVLCMALAACGTKNVKFVNGEFAADASDITIQLMPGETELLNQMKDLKSADFTGSVNYDEILSWSANHPEVLVSFAVYMPDGTAIGADQKEIDLSAYSQADFNELSDKLRYFRALETVYLSAGEAGFSEEAVGKMMAELPDVDFVFNGAEAEEPEYAPVELNLSGLSESDIYAFIDEHPDLPSVELITLGKEEDIPYSYSAVSNLAKACPNAVIDYELTLYGQAVNLSDVHLNLSHIPVEDDGAAVRLLLPAMRNCTVLDMDSSGVADEDMAVIRDENPNVKVIWRIWFGNMYSVRTDVKTLFASNPPLGGDLTPDKVKSLKYLTELENLDLGHNDMMSDISFLEYMPNLRILILMGGIYLDARPIGTLKNLEYLEMQTNLYIRDISPVGQCTNLKHLNMCYLFGVTDMSALYTLTNLERLWIGCYTNIPDEQVAAMRKIVPNCQINLTTDDPMLEGWRYISYGPDVLHPMYQEIRDTFGYIYSDGIQPNAAYYFNDPLYYERSDY